MELLRTPIGIARHGGQAELKSEESAVTDSESFREQALKGEKTEI